MSFFGEHQQDNWPLSHIEASQIREYTSYRTRITEPKERIQVFRNAVEIGDELVPRLGLQGIGLVIFRPQFAWQIVDTQLWKELEIGKISRSEYDEAAKRNYMSLLLRKPAEGIVLKQLENIARETSHVDDLKRRIESAADALGYSLACAEWSPQLFHEQLLWEKEVLSRWMKPR